jgi:hypothetical protein
MQQDYIIFTGLIAVCMIAVVAKPGLPVLVEPVTEDYFNYIENLPDGTRILWCHDNTISAIFSTMPTDIAVYNHIADQMRERDIKFAFASIWVDALGLPMLKEYLESGDIDWSGLEYGEDYVCLGWVPAMESALAGFWEDIWKTAPVDYYGTPVEELPMMEEFKNGEDITCFIFTSGTSLDPYMRQFGQRIDLCLGTTGLATITMSMHYVEKGFIDAYLLSLVPTAGYEQLIERPGLGTAFVDANSLVVLYAIGLIILSNIIYWARGRQT